MPAKPNDTLPMWFLVIPLYLLAGYCLLTAFFAKLPMVKWGAHGAPRTRMSPAGRILFATAIAFFPSGILVGTYAPKYLRSLMGIFLINLVGIMLVALRDGRRAR